MVDTHSYDRRLDPHLLRNLGTVASMGLGEKVSAAEGFLGRISPSLSAVATGFLKRIVQDFGKGENVDETNGLDATDLLVLLGTMEGEGLVGSIETQLVDMGTGFCPQGRTGRLFQLCLAFQDSGVDK